MAKKFSSKKPLSFIKKESGQMTIFIALIFQVLFVFFAMISNVGLVVHDKINLQNSADFAAIYGAQKQAEILNAIAHTNFQIRQAWKLLAWRIRVVGDFGKLSHPLRRAATGNTGPLPDQMWSYLNFSFGAGGNQGGLPPSVCVSHSGWAGGGNLASLVQGQNLCKSQSSGQIGVEVPSLPSIQIIFPPIDILLRERFENLQDRLTESCQDAGFYSWMMAAKWLVAYKFDVRNKLLRIRTLKENLEKGLDIDGNPIEQGVRKTFEANLTVGNRQAIDSFEWYNSMANLNAIDKDTWLNKIKVYPAVFFTDFTGRNSQTCRGELKGLFQIAGSSTVSGIPISQGNASFGFSLNNPLYNYSVEFSNPTTPWSDEDLMRASIGVEKNPWVSVYSGVRVSTHPTKPFFPMGNTYSLKAKSFAQAFGGRVGPWLQDSWPMESKKSTGQKIDKLLPDPWIDNAPPALNDDSIPNYSRFPGDSLGLKSELSLSYMKSFWIPSGTEASPLSIESYRNFPAKQIAGGDSLSDSGQVRRLELLAIAPDLFDATYYSIDPKASSFYNKRNQGSVDNISEDIPVNLDEKKIYVKDQIEYFQSSGMGAYAFYKLSSWKHLLSSWVSNSTLDYSFSGRFGDCLQEVEEGGDPTPGACIAGGRTGYSVKIVSQEFLKYPDIPLGGKAPPGRIVNGPPEW